MVKVECDHCGEKIKVLPYKIESQNHFFCNQRHFREWRKDSVSIECETCGKEFEVGKSRKDVARFCCRECYHQWFRGRENEELKNRWRDKEFRKARSEWAKKLNERRKIPREMRTCLTCGEKFEVKENSDQEFCSVRCGNKSPRHSGVDWRELSEEIKERILVGARKGREKQRKGPSIQQLKLAKEIEKYFKDIEVDYHVRTCEDTKDRWLDVAVLSLKLDFEYDGKFWHDEKEDAIRDKEIRDIGWRPIRFDAERLKELQEGRWRWLKNEISL